jgi:5-methylcytosine-specific restriction endonuclease McrA
MRHACAKCGDATTRRGSCAKCAKPESARKRAHPNWAGVYGTARWRELSAKILKRDHHTCQVCGQPAQTAGHTEPFNGPDDPKAWAEPGIRAECRRCNGREGAKRGMAMRQAKAMIG